MRWTALAFYIFIVSELSAKNAHAKFATTELNKWKSEGLQERHHTIKYLRSIAEQCDDAKAQEMIDVYLSSIKWAPQIKRGRIKTVEMECKQVS